MFLKSDGSLNFATTLQVTLGQGLDETGERSGGVAFLDAPNIMCSLYSLTSPPIVDPGKLDLQQLYDYLFGAHGVRRFDFVIASRDGFARWGLRTEVLKRHWRYQEVAKPRFGWDVGDPVDDYIREHIARVAEDSKPKRTIALISHDGGYAPVLEHALDQGNRLFLVGLLEQMSHRLHRLRGVQAKIVDLREFGRLLPRRPAIPLLKSSPAASSNTEFSIGI